MNWLSPNRLKFWSRKGFNKNINLNAEESENHEENRQWERKKQELVDALYSNLKRRDNELLEEIQRAIEESNKRCNEEKQTIEIELKKRDKELETERQRFNEEKQTIEIELKKRDKEMETERQRFNEEKQTIEIELKKRDKEMETERQSFNEEKQTIEIELKKRDKELDTERQRFNKEKQTMKKNIGELSKRNDNLAQENRENKEKLKKQYDENQYMKENTKELNDQLVLEKQHLKELKTRYDELETEKQYMDNDIDNLRQQIRAQRSSFEQKLKQVQESHKKKIDGIRQKLDERGNGLCELEEKNAKLREEASKYQSALGVATNTRLGDDDQNHSVKLKQDIIKLQGTLENYVTHLRPNMDLDIKQIQILAQEYGCLNKITEENPNKSFIRSILQRKVLDVVYNLSFELLSGHQGEPAALELEMELKAQDLLKSIEIFSTTRVGTDEVINAAAIKIRQQVYGILGNRGFNDIICPDGTIHIHDLINYVSNELNKIMNQYRKINDINRKEQVEAMAPRLVQSIYKLFLFRVNVQEPKTEKLFFNCNERIDSSTMKGMWNEEEVDQLCVDICYFPLIGRNLDSPERKIYTPAKVIPRNINSSDGISEELGMEC